MKTKVHELLGVEPNERFKIMSCGTTYVSDYYINSKGTLWECGDKGEMREPGNSFLTGLLNGNLKIIRRPTLTDEQREVLELLRNIGLNKVARDEDGSITAFEKCPVKGRDYWLSGAEGGYCETQRLSCLRPLIPDWTVPLDIEQTLREAGVME